MLYKIRCNPMHPLYGGLPVPYVPVRVTRGVVIVHLYTYEPPRCTTSQYRMTFIHLSVSLWNDTPYSMAWDWRVSIARPMPFYWPSCSLPFCLLLTHFLFFHSMGWYCGAGIIRLIGCQSLSPTLALPTFFNNNNNNNN